MMKIQMQAAGRVTLVIRSFAPVQKAHPPTDNVAHPQKITAHGLTHSFMSVELPQEPVDEGVQRQAPQGFMESREKATIADTTTSILHCSVRRPVQFMSSPAQSNPSSRVHAAHIQSETETAATRASSLSRGTPHAPPFLPAEVF